MKKIFILIITAITAIMFVTSCNPNKYPVFDDANAFVAFNKTTYRVPEQDYIDPSVILKIPVTLSSVAGLTETITYEVIDGKDTLRRHGAKRGVNYDLADPSATLNFDAEHRTVNIPIRIIPQIGPFTGDLYFTIKFVDTGNITDGEANECEIIIEDIDHPLASILGTYTITAYACSELGDAAVWDLTIEKDEEDITIVWLSGLVPGGGMSEEGGIYGKAEMAEDGVNVKDLVIPIGQQFDMPPDPYWYDGKTLLMGIDAELYYCTWDESESIIIEFSEGGKKMIYGAGDWGPAAGGLFDEEGSDFDIFDGVAPGGIGVKK